MSTTIPDLWPADIATSTEPSPAAVLRQQGYWLGQKTRNFVVGEVRSNGTASEFTHEFWVSAPLLNVRVRLLWVQHGLRFYPARVRVFQVHDQPTQWGEHVAENLVQLSGLLQSVFAGDEVRELIQSLTNQSRDLNE